MKGEPEHVISVFRREMDADLLRVGTVERFLDKKRVSAVPERR